MAMMDTSVADRGIYDGHKWHAAELLVAYYLADAGFCVSFPMIPAPYDLIADDGNGLVRIQVKRAVLKPQRVAKQGKRDRPRYVVDLAGSKALRFVRDFDWLCVVTGKDDVYVIPVSYAESPVVPGKLVGTLVIKPEASNGRKDSLEAGQRWENFKNNWGALLSYKQTEAVQVDAVPPDPPSRFTDGPQLNQDT